MPQHALISATFFAQLRLPLSFRTCEERSKRLKGLRWCLVWLGLAFEIIEPFIRINPIILFALGVPLISKGAKTITEDYLFTDKLIAYGPCPSCEYENRLYFGDILGVEGFSDEANVKCPNCKTVFTVQRKSLRASTLPK